MSVYSALDRPEVGQSVLSAGLLMGLAGGLVEIIVVCLFSALTGGDAAMVGRQVASSFGLDGASAAAGVAVHMGLALALGIVLSAMVQILTALSDRSTWAFMTGSLAAVWAINFFIVLPVISPSFVHLLPYAVTLASKLAFGIAAAAALQGIRRARLGTFR